MLNRKLSEYLFYGSLVLIVVVIFLIRITVLGNLNTQIDQTDASNISLETQITALEEVVQENKNVQTSNLYELYDIIPNVYSGTELVYTTVSILESLGVNESNDMQRTVFVENDPVFGGESIFTELALEYHMVEVQVFFTTTDADVVNNFIDALYQSEQLFIVRELDYNIPDGEDFIGISVSFLAIYDVDIEEES